MTIHWFTRNARCSTPGLMEEGPLPPGLQNHPIRDSASSADRGLTLALTTLVMIMLSAGSAALFMLNTMGYLRPSRDRLQTVRLQLDDGPSDHGGPSPLGGGRATDQVKRPLEGPPQPLAALAFSLSPKEETPSSVVPLEVLPNLSQDLLTLQPGLIASAIPGQGNGVGNGLGREIGNGLGSGLGHGRGATWIHSARGDEELKVAVNFMRFKDYISPDYPEAARLNQISGDVVIAVTIDSSGNLIKWTVLEGHPALVEATLLVFPRWHFLPPVYRGEPVGASFEVRIRFTLM